MRDKADKEASAQAAHALLMHLSMRKEDFPIPELCPRAFATLEHIDATRGHCDDCNLTVHNLSAMSEVEAKEVWDARSGHMCINYKCDQDGNIVFADSAPALLPASRLTAKRTFATVAASLLLAACGPNNEQYQEWTGPGQAPDADYWRDSSKDSGSDARPTTLEYGGPAPLRDSGPPAEDRDAGKKDGSDTQDAGTPDAQADGSTT